MKTISVSQCWKLAFAIGLSVGLAAIAVDSRPALAAWYSTAIEHKQANTVILDREDLKGWPADAPNSDDRQFTGVTVSGGGTKVLFSACAYYTASGTECRPFVVDSNGTGLQDGSAVFPADLVSRSWGWGNLRINDAGSRFFVKVQRYEYLVINEMQVNYFDIPAGTVGRAQTDGFYPDGAWWFNINATGSRFYEGEYDNGPSEGFWYTNFGGSKTLIFDVASLPCDPASILCDSLNLSAFLGSSAQNDRTFFSWTHKFLGNAHADNRAAMWVSDLSGNKHQLTSDEHYWVWEGDWRGVSNGAGTKALYGRVHTSGDPYQLFVVDVATGTEQLVTWSPSVSNYPVTFMTRSGRYVFARGESGDAGFHYHTLIDLSKGGERDTWSYYLPPSWEVSNITNDDRYYYVTAPPPGSSYGQLLYRVDTAATTVADFTQAPNLTAIECTAPALIHADGVTVAFTAQVTDAQGLSNIDWVNLSVLVDGREEPPWPMGREPLAFPTGDPGATLMYDDGTHGDAVAGDGIFTFDAVATRKGDYEGFNTWYSHFSLPHDVGIRIIAKDKDENFTIADTRLTIAYIYAQPKTLAMHPGETGQVAIFGAGTPYTVTSSDPTVVAATVGETRADVSALRPGRATLTIRDGSSNTVQVMVMVRSRGNPALPPLLLMD
jgi:hypothetical protein